MSDINPAAAAAREQSRAAGGRFGVQGRTAPDPMDSPEPFSDHLDADVDVASLRDADTGTLWEHVTSPEPIERYHAARADRLSVDQAAELLDERQPFAVRHAVAATPAGSVLAASDPDPVIRHRVFRHGFLDPDTRQTLSADPQVQAVERLFTPAFA